MKLVAKDIIYLSGPMTGIEDFNLPAFQAAAADLRGRGFTVIVPGEWDDITPEELVAMSVSRHRRAFFLSRDIDFIQESATCVVTIDGWEESEGAKLEVAVAQALGIPVYDYATGAIQRREVVLDVR